MTALVLALYVPALAAAAAATWRRPTVALYLFALGLPLHNLVMSLLYGAGVRDLALDAVQAWKEILLATAIAATLARRRLPRPTAPDLLAAAFAVVVLLYAVIPQELLGGRADGEAILYALRHDLVLVATYLLGRSLGLAAAELRRLAWAVLGGAAAVALFGLVELYTVPIEWWRGSGAVGYFRQELGYEYHGPGGLPENFAFNTEDGLFRRLVSTFVSPLATAYMLVVALLLATCLRGRARLPLAALAAAGLLWTFSRSALVALAGALVVLAVARRRVWPVAAAVAVLAVGVGFAAAFPSIAPRTHWFPSDLPYQEAQARAKGPLPKGSGLEQTVSLGEPSLRSHLDALRDGAETVVRHPQGYGLGNAGTTAARFDVPLRAGESNYTELGVETGLAGLLLFLGWNLALLVGLVRAGGAAAAAVAAALAAVLALAVQTDVVGVPWLAYCLWWLGGALLRPREAGQEEPASAAGRIRVRAAFSPPNR